MIKKYQGRKGGSSGRVGRKSARCVILIFAAVFLLALRPNCDNRDPTLTSCEDDIRVTVDPGTCVYLDNPCDSIGAWEPWDTFGIAKANTRQSPQGLYVLRTSGLYGVTRQLCAVPDVAPYIDEPIEYLYQRPNPGGGRPDFGTGRFLITTGPSLSAAASAVPANVLPGDPVQLDVTVSNGTAPYTFFWSALPPGGGINPADVTLQNPLAYPQVSTTYTVVVTDADGKTAADPVYVNVAFSLSILATPATISPGSASQLDARASGGIPPYTYSWVPISTLDDPGIATPLASPAVSTLYTVTVTDSVGNTAQGSVTVNVTASPLVLQTISAAPNPVTYNTATDLLIAVTGGVPPYTYEWSPNTLLANNSLVVTSNTSLLSTTVPMPNSWVFNAAVTDSTGDRVTNNITVTVDMQLNVTATPGTIDAGQSSQLDVSVLGGDPLPKTYSWAPVTGLSDPNIQAPVASPAATTTYTVTATDTLGQQKTGSVTVTVNPPPSPITACFTVDFPPVVAGGVTGFDASCSSGGPGLQYRWEFRNLDTGWFMRLPGDGSFWSVPITDAVPLNLPSGSTLEVTLFVRDSSGNTDFLVQRYIL